MIVVKQLLWRQIHDWIDEISIFVNKFWSVFFILGTFPIYIWSHRKFFLLTFSIPLRMLKLDIGNFITFHNFPMLKLGKTHFCNPSKLKQNTICGVLILSNDKSQNLILSNFKLRNIGTHSSWRQNELWQKFKVKASEVGNSP